MRLRAIAIAACCAAFATGCQPDQPEEAPQATSREPVTQAVGREYQATHMTAKELRAHQAKADTLIVDVRPPESYAREHIEGAINIPWAKLAQGHAQLPKDRFIALYCT